MKDALAAYKQAAADMVKACPAVIARSIDDCADVCALFNVTKKDVKDRMDRLGKITLDIDFLERGRDATRKWWTTCLPCAFRSTLRNAAWWKFGKVKPSTSTRRPPPN